MDMHKPSPRLLEFLRRWEGFRKRAYLCSGGVWTIGYGRTRDVEPGDVTTRETEEAHLLQDAAHAVEAVNRLVEVALAPHEVDALASWVFNVGEGAAAESTLIRRLNAGERGAVPHELTRWKYAGGRVVQGLVNRRAAEIALWRKPAAKGRRSPVESDTVKAAAAQIAQGGGLVAGANLVGGLQPEVQLALVIGGLAIVALGAWIMRERLRKWAEGDR